MRWYDLKNTIIIVMDRRFASAFDTYAMDPEMTTKSTLILSYLNYLMCLVKTKYP